MGRSTILKLGAFPWHPLAVVLFLSVSAAAAELPATRVGNPIAEYYGDEAYPWTHELRWNRVFNILNFGGDGNGSADNLSAYRRAHAAATAAGGGVIYFPAGSYPFSDSITIGNNVVLMGDVPTNTNAKQSGFNPPSKLEFPRYAPSFSGSGTPNSTAFKKITAASGHSDSNTGLVWLDVNRAGIELGGFDADKSNSNTNIVIFGVRNNNVATPEPGVPNSSLGQHAWQRYGYRFTHNISVLAYADVLVANCRVNDNVTDTYSYSTYVVEGRTLTGGKVKFNYTDHYGIGVNRGYPGGYGKGETPETNPTLFREGIAIRDNWVYHTMRVAIHVSGQGLVIQDNVIRDRSGKEHWTNPPGTKPASNAQTLENRGIDWSGWDVLVKGNDVQVYRHKLKDTTYSSVDGEGILIQECCGGTTVNGVRILDNTANAYIGLYKTRDIHNATIKGNTVAGDGILVLADTNTENFAIYDTVIENNNVSGDILLDGSGAQGSGNAIRNNIGHGGKIRWSCATNASISGNTGFGVPPCE